ncbi:MAG: oligosaccharide flippase family protein [Rikenellaceae bacterium]
MIRKLAGQTAIYGLGTIIPRFVNYLLTPYLTYSLALNEYNFGVMGYFYATIPFAVAILTMGMETGYFRFCGKATSLEEKNKLFSTILSTLIVSSLTLFIVICFIQNDIYETIGQVYAPQIISIVAALIVTDVVSSISFAKLREEGRAKLFTIIRGSSVLINVAFVVFFYSLLPLIKDIPIFSFMWIENFGAGYVFVANLIASIITMFMLHSTYKGAHLYINPKILKSVLFFSFPLFISGFNGIANDFIDRQLLAVLAPHDIALEQIGIYSATLKIAAIMTIFTQMYRYAAEPMFLSKLKKDDFNRDNAEAMKYFIIVSLAIFLGITLFSDIFILLVSPAFRAGANLIPVILFAGLLSGVLVNLSFWYKFNDKTFYAIIITSVVLIITVILIVLLIPHFVYNGSAWGRLISMTAMVLLSYFLNQKYFPIPYDIKRIGEYLGLTAILFGLSYITDLEPTIFKYFTNSILMLIFVAYAIKREKMLFLFKRNGSKSN